VLKSLIRISTAMLLFFSCSVCSIAKQGQPLAVLQQLAKLERNAGVSLGVYAYDTNSGKTIAYHADDSFPVESTFKLLLAAQLLKASEENKNLLRQTITYSKSDLVPWHPITGQYVNSSLSTQALAEAAISYSDNTAANLLFKLLGGPEKLTQFAHQLGNKSFNMQHYEPALNADPAKQIDASTPRDMGISLQKLLLGSILTSPHKKLLLTWLRNSTTGYKRIRSAADIAWVVADKTGTGSYSNTNDIALLWSPACKPIVLAIYSAAAKASNKHHDELVAAASSVVLAYFAEQNSCAKQN